MVNVKQELMNFSYRELNVNWKDLFPRINFDLVRTDFTRFQNSNPHQTIFDVAKELWDGKYESVLKENGFWDTDYPTFGGHCHQCTPVLGLALSSLGFEVAYLECQRIESDFESSGLINKVDPRNESNDAMRDQFCKIGRIPYCCLEVTIDGEKFYLTGKHLKPEGKRAKALLSPSCYIDFVGTFAHQADASKSGIYLRTVRPKVNPHNVDFSKQVVWTKQTERDLEPEYFATFLRMNLTA